MGRKVPYISNEEYQTTWDLKHLSGVTPRELWDAGFRPRSNKYRLAVKEWKYYGEYYSVELTLSPNDYSELKSCPLEIAREEEETEERAEYERFLYLQEKYGDES
jgi:hypothetical protein